MSRAPNHPTRPWLASAALLIAWSCYAQPAAARPRHSAEYEDGYAGDFALSLERFMGLDFVSWEAPRRDDVTARLFLNASELVPTSYARVGADYFISRLSLGVAGGLTTRDVVVLAPRIGYMFGLARGVSLWLRVGMFVTHSGPDYVGLTAEALFHFWIHHSVSLHLGPTLDIGFANHRAPNYAALGIPEMGLTVWF